MTPFCLPDILQQSSERYPTKVAIVCDQKRFSYEALDAKAAEIAATLRHLGVRKGEPVLSSMANSMEFVAAFFAIARVGGVIVPINPDLPLREFQYIAGHCEDRVLLTSGGNRKL